MNKNTFLLVVLFSLISTNSFTQSVFPLKIGNTWYYEITYEFYDPPRPPSYYTFKIVNDTLMPNGKIYYIFEPADMFWQKYIGSDSSFVYYWDANCNCEKRVFNINAKIGEEETLDWVYFTATLNAVYQTSLFNEPINLYTYNLGGLIFADIHLSERFGYAGFNYFGDYQWERDNWGLIGCIISDTLYGETVNVKNRDEIPLKIELLQNFPNPFNPSTKIKFTIPNFTLSPAVGGEGSFVTLKIYDVLGNEVSRLVNEEKPAGTYEVHFDAAELSTGIYFYRLHAGSFTSTKKMIYVK